MTIANPVNFYDNFVFGSYTGDNGAGHWDGYSETYSTNIFGGILQGGFLNWGGFDMLTTAGGTSEIPYSGYASNWGGLSMQSLGSNTETPYMGYSANWGKASISTNLALDVVDINSVIDHPKDQTIYYKLKGWNPLTSTYEVWVISENITGRPELFDPVPGRTPPNTERDIYKTPPSGNSLTNIVIVARWIQ
jgi:hypothetical protein